MVMRINEILKIKLKAGSTKQRHVVNDGTQMNGWTNDEMNEWMASSLSTMWYDVIIYENQQFSFGFDYTICERKGNISI